MAYPATSFSSAVDLTITAANQVYEVINGDSLSTVVVETGEIPSLRKALVDNFYFISPIDWDLGNDETVFNQLRTFTDGSVWWSPLSTVSNPVTMTANPYTDSNWTLFVTRNTKLTQNYDTLNSAVVSTTLFDGAIVDIKERTVGNKGGATWDVVLASTVTPNSYNIVQCIGVPTLALVLRLGPQLEVNQWGVNKNDAAPSDSMVNLLANTDIDVVCFKSSGEYEFAGDLEITHTPLTISGDGQSSKIEISNSVNSNGFDLKSGTGGSDITIKDIKFNSTPTAGIFTQAITLNNCVNVNIKDVNINGFTQFPISLRYTLSQAFGSVNIKNVHVTDASFPALGVSNAFEIFSGGSNGFINDLVVEDCSFSLGSGKGGNIAKFGVSEKALINRCSFNAIGRTGESGSSGVECGSSTNSTVDSIEFRDCVFNDNGQTTGLYGFASRAQKTLLTRCEFVSGNNSIFFPDDINEFKAVDCFISKILFASGFSANRITIEGGEIEQNWVLENGDVKEIILKGVKIPTLTLGQMSASTNIKIIDCDIDIINTKVNTLFNSVEITEKGPRQMSLQNGTINKINIYKTGFVIEDLTHFLKATDLVEVHHCTFFPGSNNTSATNMIEVQSNARFTHNYVDQVNRTFHVTVTGGAVLGASMNTHYDTVDSNVYGIISGTINSACNVINDTFVA